MLACATSLARDRHFRKAQQLLASLGPEPRALDLLARIHVQYGRVDEARDCWKQVLVALPHDLEATRGLQALNNRSSRFLLRYRVGVAGAIALAVLALSMFVTGAAWQVRHSRRSAAPVQSAQTKPEFRPMSRETVNFPVPLYLSGTRLSRPGRELLVKLGDDLRGRSIDRIEIVGQADLVRLRSASRYRSNQELALARAAKARDVLVAAGVDVRKIFLQAAIQESAVPNSKTVFIQIISAEVPGRN